MPQPMFNLKTSTTAILTDDSYIHRNLASTATIYMSSLFSAVSVSAVCAVAWRSNARIWAPCSKSSALGGVRHNVPLIPHTQLLLRFGRFHWLFLHSGIVDVVF